jgi:hypothetical protein
MDLASSDRMDPVLEISIDDSRSPVIVELVGALDQSTRVWLMSRMEALLSEGIRDFVMDLRRAVVDAPGALALVLCQRRVRETGGTLLWEGVRFAPVSTDAVREPAIAC